MFALCCQSVLSIEPQNWVSNILKPCFWRKPGKSLDKFEKRFFEKIRPTSPIKRFAAPEEVASLGVYIASPLASATTAVALRVDGVHGARRPVDGLWPGMYGLHQPERRQQGRVINA
jgi:NAD(P)-dependent dehydrogenase (short-subunit alcohol dehydrogenase family)